MESYHILSNKYKPTNANQKTFQQILLFWKLFHFLDYKLKIPLRFFIYVYINKGRQYDYQIWNKNYEHKPKMTQKFKWTRPIHWIANQDSANCSVPKYQQTRTSFCRGALGLIAIKKWGPKAFKCLQNSSCSYPQGVSKIYIKVKVKGPHTYTCYSSWLTYRQLIRLQL